MSDHRTILLYVPVKLPEDIAHEFIITHREGDTGQDAWQKLITLAAVRENPLTMLIHRLWVEAGGDAGLKPGEVTEGELMNLIHEHKNVANEVAAKKPFDEILQVKDVHGKPMLSTKDAAGVPINLLVEQLANHLVHHAPFAHEVLLKAAKRWQDLKDSGQPQQ